jgi:hypothetical protein
MRVGWPARRRHPRVHIAPARAPIPTSTTSIDSPFLPTQCTSNSENFYAGFSLATNSENDDLGKISFKWARASKYVSGGGTPVEFYLPTPPAGHRMPTAWVASHL